MAEGIGSRLTASTDVWTSQSINSWVLGVRRGLGTWTERFKASSRLNASINVWRSQSLGENHRPLAKEFNWHLEVTIYGLIATERRGLKVSIKFKETNTVAEAEVISYRLKPLNLDLGRHLKAKGINHQLNWIFLKQKNKNFLKPNLDHHIMFSCPYK